MEAWKPAKRDKNRTGKAGNREKTEQKNCNSKEII